MKIKPIYDALKATIRQDKTIFLIITLGFILRLIYTFFFAQVVAQYYLGHESFFSNSGDFAAWTEAIKNLFHTGNYTVNQDNSYGYFGRMPGYALFIAPFYCLLGEAYFTYAISFSQILLDTLTIYFIYKIFRSLLPSAPFPYVAPLIYAINPINILWSSALFSEALSVFVLILSLYIYSCSAYRYKYLLMGLLSGFNILVRPQVALFALAVCILLFILFLSQKTKRQFLSLSLFILGVLLCYGPWPARNYFLHDKLILTQDISGFPKWGIDVNSYLQYIVSVQGNWEPQFSQIIQNKPFQIDKKNAYATPTDSADLASAIFLSQHYGSGFSNWSGYWKEKVVRNKYDTTIAELFTKLQKNQMKYNSFHYWITLPLTNLKKCLFKFDLSKPDSSPLLRLAPLIFIFRTLIILLGIIGSVLLFRNHDYIFKVILLFFLSWYVIICWGPSAQMRNIEMRYLLQTDTLLIIPAAYLINQVLKKKYVFFSSTLKVK